MKAYAYLRVSGKGQVVGTGFDRQIEAIKGFCKKAGYEIDWTYREQVSGTKDETDRPEFKAMVAEILRDGGTPDLSRETVESRESLVG